MRGRRSRGQKWRAADDHAKLPASTTEWSSVPIFIMREFDSISIFGMVGWEGNGGGTQA